MPLTVALLFSSSGIDLTFLNNSTMQKVCSLIASLLLVLNVIGQDSIPVKKEPFVPIGIYYKSKSFFNKSQILKDPSG